MIHTTTQTGKFRRLVRKLRPMLAEMPVSVELVATGILERIWHIGISDAFRGDIGKLDNEEIAEMVGWHGDADAFVDLLVEEKWLDRHPTHRLLIHDWHEHAPKYVKGNAAKSGGFYTINGDSPKEPPSDAKDSPLGDDTLPYLPNKLINQGEGTNGVSYKNLKIDDDEWEELRPELQGIKDDLFGDRILPQEDRETLIRDVLVAGHYLPANEMDRIRRNGKRLKKRNKLDSPMGYLHTCVSTACNENGVVLKKAAASFVIPDKYLNPPKAQPP